MKKKLILLSVSLIGILFSCKNTFDVNENWSEIPVIFGLLNQSDSIQYIKINKAFLGNQSAFMMAANYDTVNYGHQLDVKINEISNNAVINTFTLLQDTSLSKPHGIFAYPKQIFYKLANHTLDPNDVYELVVTNTHSGHVARARTQLVQDFSVISPSSFQQINFTIPNSDYHVQWLSGVYGKEYNLTIRFWYTEENKLTHLIRQRYVDWGFPDVFSSGLGGGEAMEVIFKSQSFYTMLRSRPEIKPNDSLWRYVGKVSDPSYDLDFLLTAAGDEFATYMDVNRPIDGPSMTKPYYTNITNGVGLFSSRYSQMAAQLFGKQLTGATVDSIYAGQFTYNLGFCSPVPTDPYHCN